MKMLLGLVSLLLGGALSGAMAADTERVSAPGGCPSVVHIPLVNVMRGTPAGIKVNVDCPVGEVTEVILQVRLTDLGKPTPIPMTGEGNGVYSATVPVSMVQGIARFWYYIDARGKGVAGEPTSVQTGWKPVNIIDPVEVEKAGGGGNKAAYFVAGGVAVVAGALVIDNNSGGGSGGGNNGSGPAPTGNGGGGNGGGDGGDDSGDAPEEDCTRTSFEKASLGGTSPCGESAGIEVYVCNNCPDATISAVTSWGVVRQAINQPTRSCGDTQQVLLLPFPDGFPNGPESETIRVFVNGELIQTFLWPSSADYFNCL